jgi:integrase
MAKRISKRLTALAVTAHINQKKPGRYPDGGNLFLKIDDAGTPSWVMRYHSPVHGRVRDGGLGSAKMSLADARAKRDEWRRLIDSGADPIDARKADKLTTIVNAQTARTFGECTDAWLETADQELTREKTRVARRRAIETHLKALRDIPAATVTPSMVVNLLKPLMATKANTAHRLRAYVHAILQTADKLGTPTDSSKFTASYFRGLLPRKEAVQPTQHYKAMPVGEVPSFMTRLKAEQGSAARCLQFAILTALRSHTAIGLRWSYVESRVATFPPTDMKTKTEFRCALSQHAVDLLQSQPRVKGCPYAFVGRYGGRLSERALSNVIQRLGAPFAVHGFRSTFRHYIGEHTDFDTSLAEHALAHLVGGKVERAYARGDNLQKRFAVMQAWADHCDPRPIPEEGKVEDNVLHLPGRKASA